MELVFYEVRHRCRVEVFYKFAVNQLREILKEVI